MHVLMYADDNDNISARITRPVRMPSLPVPPPITNTITKQIQKQDYLPESIESKGPYPLNLLYVIMNSPNLQVRNH